MDTASVSANSVTASADGARWRILSSVNDGADNGGRLAGSAPTVAMLVTSAPNHQSSSTANKLPPTIAAIMYGMRGSQRLTAIPMTSVATATAVA